MKRTLLLVLLGAGTVLGFGSGFWRMTHHSCHGQHHGFGSFEERREAYKKEFAEACAQAAREHGPQPGAAGAPAAPAQPGSVQLQ